MYIIGQDLLQNSLITSLKKNYGKFQNGLFFKILIKCKGTISFIILFTLYWNIAFPMWVTIRKNSYISSKYYLTHKLSIQGISIKRLGLELGIIFHETDQLVQDFI